MTAVQLRDEINLDDYGKRVSSDERLDSHVDLKHHNVDVTDFALPLPAFGGSSRMIGKSPPPDTEDIAFSKDHSHSFPASRDKLDRRNGLLGTSQHAKTIENITRFTKFFYLYLIAVRALNGIWRSNEYSLPSKIGHTIAGVGLASFLATRPLSSSLESATIFLKAIRSSSFHADYQSVLQDLAQALRRHAGRSKLRLRVLRSQIRRWLRPSTPDGYGRIEWKCDCGEMLYGDFTNNSPQALRDLAMELQNNPSPDQSMASDSGYFSNSSSTPPNSVSPEITVTSPGGSNTDSLPSSENRLGSSDPLRSSGLQSGCGPKFLQLCVNTGGMYITLSELDIRAPRSDAKVFQMMKEAYLKHRGHRSRFSFLIKPVSVEFVQFTLWSKLRGYVSIGSRPVSIPPPDAEDWEYQPCPLTSLPPMPPEVFIHYLEHGEGDLNPLRNTWTPRLPKKLDVKTVSGDEGDFGWGIHIVEGPNRVALFWIMMLTIAGGVLTTVAWSLVKGDAQGGTGLGTLIVALPSVILAAFLFRLGHA